MARVAARRERCLPQARGHPARERGPVYRAPRAPGVEGVARLRRKASMTTDAGPIPLRLQLGA